MLIRVLFLSLIKVNGEHFAVKIDGLLFHPSLREGLNANSHTFLVTRQGKWRTLCCENWWIMFHPLLRKGLNANSRTFLVTPHGKWRTLCCENWWIMFHPLLRKGLNANLRTFLVTRQGKRRRLSLRKNVTFFFTKPTCPPQKPAFGRLFRRAALEKIYPK